MKISKTNTSIREELTINDKIVNALFNQELINGKIDVNRLLDLLEMSSSLQKGLLLGLYELNINEEEIKTNINRHEESSYIVIQEVKVDILKMQAKVYYNIPVYTYYRYDNRLMSKESAEKFVLKLPADVIIEQMEKRDVDRELPVYNNSPYSSNSIEKFIDKTLKEANLSYSQNNIETVKVMLLDKEGKPVMSKTTKRDDVCMEDKNKLFFTEVK